MFPWSVCPTPLLVNLEWSPSCWTQGKDQEATWDNNGWVTWHNITTRLWTDEEDPVGNENHAVRERTRFSKLCTFILHAAKSCMLSSNSISSPPPHKARLFSKVQLSVVFYMFVALIFIWLFSIPICNSALLQILPQLYRCSLCGCMIPACNCCILIPRPMLFSVACKRWRIYRGWNTPVICKEF